MHFYFLLIPKTCLFDSSWVFKCEMHRLLKFSTFRNQIYNEFVKIRNSLNYVTPGRAKFQFSPQIIFLSVSFFRNANSYENSHIYANVAHKKGSVFRFRNLATASPRGKNEGTIYDSIINTFSAALEGLNSL